MDDVDGVSLNNMVAIKMLLGNEINVLKSQYGRNAALQKRV